MNFFNYDRLVTDLQTMNPADFDYLQGARTDIAGCVDCRCRLLMGETVLIGNGGQIRRFLDVTEDESIYLWRAADPNDPHRLVTVGPYGIANALHRLSVVAANYVRPSNVPTVTPATFQPNEQAFLDSIRSLVASAEIGDEG